MSIWFDFSGKSHPKSTKENPVVDFEECVKLIKEKTMDLVNPKPITLNQNQIAAFSYFFERAIETGLVGQYIVVFPERFESVETLHSSF